MTGDQLPALRVVIDPNVLISATITPRGALGQIIGLIDSGTVVPVVCPHLVDEFENVLKRPKFDRYLDPARRDTAIAEFKRLAEWHPDPVNPPQVVRDSNDDYLVALASTANADALTTGDEDLHAVGDPEVVIISPRDLLSRLGQ
ncbi:MAG: putative toxin-antitoxin system toxin component, PIN family [Frankiaceae bacterium]|jgi:putative PIN family toxin of toxin-antitoxin system|nr:putative toxin-antitoxin system toxin component, PIN family [Frankiaceae bacterium]